MESYKAPPMELLDSRFDAEVMSTPHLSPGHMGRSEWVKRYAVAQCPTKKAELMVNLGRGMIGLCQPLGVDGEFPASCFLGWVASVWMDGIKGDRFAFSWMHLKWSLTQQKTYVAKALRHLSVAEDPDRETVVRLRHAAAVYCNANILWHYSSIWPEWESTYEDMHKV